MQLNEKSLKKFKSKWMVEAWPHVQLFHGEGVVFAILVDNFIGKEKNLRLLISFGFGHQKKKGNAKEAKEKWTQKNEEKGKIGKHIRRGKDKVCVFHFFFILWT